MTPTRSDQDTAGEPLTVLIVGAGPVGMSAALALDARGVDVAILEAESKDRERPGTRADYIHGSTLAILEAAHPGLGERIVEDGLMLPRRRTCWKGREVYSKQFPVPDSPDELDGLPHSTRIPQPVIEDYMIDALEERSVPIYWDSPVETVDSTEEGVRVETRDGRTWNVPYVIGTDGAGSTVRKEIGVSMSGSESPNTFLIIDVDEISEDPLDPVLTFHYGHPDVDGRNVLIAPFKGGWRVDLTLRTSDDVEMMTSDENVREFVAATLGERYADHIAWVTTYQFKHVTADRFIDEDKRVLLAGDSAHLLAPFGGRGMNSGIHDADLAAWAVAGALNAETRELADRDIENYARIREEAADWNTSAAKQAFEHIYSDRFTPNAKKWLAAQLGRVSGRAGAWLDKAHFGPHESPPIHTTGKF
ncbi:FAD-dependent monooxygenase [Halobellus sp. GM3]|uniref:FAD-dependent monooxygenase n=1 Tax=Halobellus sp. GM3 TaxID=3458410 RepID=UPI00403DF192